MNRLRRIVEWNAFGVCSAIGEHLGISTSKIRQYFIYTSILTMGSPVIIYLILAFWKNMRRYMWAARRNPWYYL
ncbi:MAG: PspC domain-containing protein [Chitinophagaceae bacterium]|nr:PspC domain-containing protein [Chitinophagaceae bacterium]